jgi:quercetin dioxygenase-like cupin family protein
MGMIGRHSDGGYTEVFDGIRIKTINVGERMLMTEFRMDRNARLPEHSHPQEQSGYLVSGRLRLYMEDRSFELGPGDNWCVPGNIKHKADVLEDAVAVEVFSPVREEYRQYMNPDDVTE